MTTLKKMLTLITFALIILNSYIDPKPPVSTALELPSDFLKPITHFNVENIKELLKTA